jgi:hypothetical protein
MNNLIETRKKVYENFPKENLSANSSGIVLFYDINDDNYKALTTATQNFLLKSLSLIHGREFTWTDTFLEDNDELIQALPNKTPNGVLNPKNETSAEFVEIQKAVNSIFESLGVYNHIKKLAIPNIRYKSIKESPEAKNRPYYTSKIHSDAWVGHQGDSIFLIGILGDINNNTVEFNEPIGAHDNYLHKAENFDEGNTRYESLEYLGILTSQKLGVMDHACAHRTLIKEGSKPRISLDIAVLVDSEYSHSNDEGFDISAYAYYDAETLKAVGTDKTYQVDESIFNSTTTKIQVVNV